jgi:membrane dipeptidase
MSIHLTEEQEGRAHRLHSESLVFDYIPPGEPIVMSPGASRAMEAGLVQGLPAGAILGRMNEARLQDLETDPGFREQMAGYWREVGVNCVTTTLGGLNTRDFSGTVADIARWYRRFQVSGYFRLVTTTAEAHQAKEDGKVGVIFNLQNASPIGEDLEKLDTLYNFGVRIIQLTYNLRNLVGDGCTERSQGGLSHFGAQVVQRMNQLGMVVDLSHCGYRTAMDALELSTAPPAFTHAFCQALVEHDRAKTDEQLKAMAGRGGYLGILAVPFFLSKDPNAGLEVMLDHIDHAMEVMGPDKVGIGTDWGSWTSEVPEPLRAGVKAAFHAMGFREEHGLVIGGGIGEMGRYKDWYQITRGLVSRGYRDAEIQGLLGGNFLNYFGKVVRP